MAEAKTKPTEASVSAFIAAVPNQVRRRDARALLEMMSEISGETPVTWGPTIIGFGVRDYLLANGKTSRTIRIGFSPRAANLVVYASPKRGEGDPLYKKLGKYKTGKACLYINKLADVDLGALRQIIARGWRA
ncbi:MAG TPA: DUF1801 domain-containing protein [Caulobacterales bacterium]|jgi:hypothetical protein|nr:DUF1801 domain-containing protein [Caulobacterales bacterium]